MSRVSPTLEGFRAGFQRPSLTFTEIAWRWTVGAVAWGLFLFSFVEYLSSLPVTNSDAALLRTRQPWLVGRAIAHILRGSLSRAGVAALLGALALSLLWIVASSVGRAATVRALLDYFGGRFASNISVKRDGAMKSSPWRSLIGLNFLRVVLAMAALLAFAGAAILVRFTSPDAHPHSGLAFMLFLPLAGLICFVWPMLNWLLSLACIFAVRDGDDVLSALSAAVTFVQERWGAVLRREYLDRTGAPRCHQHGHDCCFVSAGFHPSRPDAADNCRRHARDARVLRRCGLVVYGAPRGIRLHRRNAGGPG